MKFKAKIIVKLKEKIKDSKGEAVSAVLRRIGLEDCANVRIGKVFEFEITSKTKDGANFKLQNIIKDVLVNPVVETYEILEFVEAPAPKALDTVNCTEQL